MPSLDTLSQLVTLHEGDQVVSSGDGGLLPPGLPIGTVVGKPGEYRVSLLADPAASEDVEVLGFRHPPETPPAASASELPAVAAGLPPAAPPAPAPKPVLPALPALKPTSPPPVLESGDRDD
jgi:rod shape-determining protein MreC